jgi:deazaflavin-dependent oxidoreductase (nitroreductase family)
LAHIQRTRAVELFWKIHKRVYRLTRGRVGGRLMGLPVLLLDTQGRRTGRVRTSALMYLPDEDRFVVIASCLGEPRHPAWWLNLEAHPEAEIEIRGQRIPVVAREAQAAERERIWNEVVSRQGDYAEYEKRTDRRIPVVIFEKR